MTKTFILAAALSATFGLGFWANTVLAKQSNPKTATSKTITHMKPGAFSISLSVKDLAVSKAFYEQLGFTVFAGGMEQHYLIMKNDLALVGLFQGMFEGNILTFNPGWDHNAKNVDPFDDVRAIQQHLKANNVTLTAEADESATGPASIMLKDPDGNLILIDQHR